MLLPGRKGLPCPPPTAHTSWDNSCARRCAMATLTLTAAGGAVNRQFSAHDARRTFARLCRSTGGEEYKGVLRGDRSYFLGKLSASTPVSTESNSIFLALEALLNRRPAAAAGADAPHDGVLDLDQVVVAL